MQNLIEALEQDLSRNNLRQQDLPGILAGPDEKPISAVAISNWKKRGVIPSEQLRRLVTHFGPSSALARAVAEPGPTFRGDGPISGNEGPAMGLSQPGMHATLGVVGGVLDSVPTSFSSDSGRPIPTLRVRERAPAPKSQTTIRTWANTDDRLRELLPEAMHRFIGRKVQLGPLQYRFDFASEFVVAEVYIEKSISGSDHRSAIPQSIYRAVTQLMCARSLNAATDLVPGEPIYGVILSSDTLPAGLRQLRFELELLDIQIAWVDSEKQIPQVISAWEQDAKDPGRMAFGEEEIEE